MADVTLEALLEEGRTFPPSDAFRRDALIRDLRVWHRGTPNRSRAPRPNLALTYTLPWMRYSMELPRIARDRFAALAPEGELPTGDMLAAELTRFLRERETGDGGPESQGPSGAH